MKLKKLGQLIKGQRKEKGLSIAELSIECGVSVWLVAKWEAGEREPKATQLANLFQVLGISKKCFVDAIERDKQMCQIS